VSLLSYQNSTSEQLLLQAVRADKIGKIPKVRVFLSYSHSDADLADQIESAVKPHLFVELSRYTNDVPYKADFIQFMNTLAEHDKVIMIISDSYMKSRACMYEVGILLGCYDYQDKIEFVVLNDHDKKHYRQPPTNSIAAKIYDEHDINQYVIYWESKVKQLEADIKKIRDVNARKRSLDYINRIQAEILNNMKRFIDYLFNIRSISFDELQNGGFIELLKELGIIEVSAQ
jgi:hypothetical protein